MKKNRYYFAIRFLLVGEMHPPSDMYTGIGHLSSVEALKVSASLNKRVALLAMFNCKAEFLEHLDLLDEEWARASKEEIEESL